MQAEVVLRKYGNSTGAVFPASVLKDLGLKAGIAMTMDTTSNGIITLTPKRKFTISELISQCNIKSPPPADIAVWDSAKPVGQEVL